MQIVSQTVKENHISINKQQHYYYINMDIIFIPFKFCILIPLENLCHLISSNLFPPPTPPTHLPQICPSFPPDRCLQDVVQKHSS